MRLSVSRPTQRSSCRDRDRLGLGLGLRSLLVTDASAAAGCGGGHVVTRVIVTMPPQSVQETTSREGKCGGGCIGEEGEGDGDDGDEGCWVTYGRRGRMRRLPPTLPSLRGAMRRARTEDGRLVINEAPAGARRPEYIRARRCGGRLTMQLVESKDFYPLSPVADPSPAQEDEDEDDIVAMQTVNDTSTVEAVGESVRGHMQKAAPPPTIGCFEDVVKYHSISLHHHHILRLRMVH